MRKRTLGLCIASVCLFALDVSAQSYKPKRINKAIELLEQGQPIYYTGGHGGYDEGLKMSQTWADYINYEMEHGVFDMTQLREFMRGLLKGGPTKSGHKTPAVIVTLPVTGIDEVTVRTNSWVVQQVLAAGVHGILLCHARTPEAVKAFVEATRYPFQERVAGLKEGLRGSGSQGYAAQMWGIPAIEYIKVADTWPLNPKGEIMLGLKIEDKFALENAEKSAKVPGIAFAEWGPGDMGWSFGLLSAHDPPYPKVMADARARVLAACKSAKIAFLNTTRPNDVEAMIREGVRIGSGGKEAAEKGRKFTKREMPW
jgi:4-hydroxy-2-oxoheptanedioate aldolase